MKSCLVLLDRYILQHLSMQSGATLRNALMYDVAFSERKKSRALLEIVQMLV